MTVILTGKLSTEGIPLEATVFVENRQLLVLLTTSVVIILRLTAFFLCQRSSSEKTTQSIEPSKPLVVSKETEPEVEDGRKKVTVFFGTQTGTAEELAEEAKVRYDKIVFKVVDLMMISTMRS